MSSSGDAVRVITTPDGSHSILEVLVQDRQDHAGGEVWEAAAQSYGLSGSGLGPGDPQPSNTHLVDVQTTDMHDSPQVGSATLSAILRLQTVHEL